MASHSTVNFISFPVALLLLAVANTVNAIPAQELESMLAAMRTRGYNLFANAIYTSDIHYEVISGNAFTFFAPINSSLFALDMTSTASDYVTALRCHVVPRRLALADLQRLPSRSSVPTLLNGREAVIERSGAFDAISVDGIRVAVPGLFYSRDLAVHGLGGIISSRSPDGSRQRSSPPTINPQPNFPGMQPSSHVPPPARSSTIGHPAQNFTGNQTSNHAPPPPPARSSTMSHPAQNFTGNQTSNHAPSPPPARSSTMSHPAQNFTGNQTSNHAPPPPPARPSAMSNPAQNSTGNHTSDHVPPPPARSSPMINPPPNFTGNHTSDHVPSQPARPSPMINRPPNFTGIHNMSNVPPPPATFNGNRGMDNKTAAAEPAIAKGISLPPVSPPETSPAPILSSVSAGDTSPKPNDGSRALLSELTSPIMYEHSMAGEYSYTSQSSMVNYQPLDEKTFDCPLTNGETRTVDHGYLYTRQRYNVPTTMTCHQTYQDTL